MCVYVNKTKKKQVVRFRMIFVHRDIAIDFIRFSSAISSEPYRRRMNVIENFYNRNS